MIVFFEVMYFIFSLITWQMLLTNRFWLKLFLSLFWPIVLVIEIYFLIKHKLR